MKFKFKPGPSLLSLCLLASCGKNLSDNAPVAQTQNEVVQIDGSNIEGFYAGDIWPVNYNLHFKKIGAVGVSRNSDVFSAHVNMAYGPKEARIQHALYTGRRCPNINDDLNKDAYVDILEARLAIGQVTIPFDGDLDSQLSGVNQTASADINGKYVYTRSASFERMFADLKSPDENNQDNITKLKEDEGLTLPGRIVLIQGLNPKIKLPESVATTDGLSAHESIPVGCAVLWKVPELPQELNQLVP
jgi:hypothetical protein